MKPKIFHSGNKVDEGNYQCVNCEDIITLPLPMEDFILPACPTCNGENFRQL